LITVLVPVLVMPAPPPKLPKVEIAPRLGSVGPRVEPVVKVHGFGAAPDAKGLPDKSVTKFEIVAVYCVPEERFATGVNVAIWLIGSYVTVPSTGAPPTPATAKEKVAVVIVTGSIALLNVALMVLFRGTLKTALAGFVPVMVGATASAVELVVKLQTKLASIAMPVRSTAPVVIVAVNSVFPERVEAGLKIAVLLAAS
jgi:hypothetical protein